MEHESQYANEQAEIPGGGVPGGSSGGSKLVALGLGLATVISVSLVVAGAVQINEEAASGWSVFLTGCLGFVLCCVIGPVALAVSRRQDARRMNEVIGATGEIRDAITQLREQTALSDDARRVLNRRSERQLLRKAIEEDIHVEDWDAAMTLVRELAERFGYRKDAEEFRERIEQARFEVVDRQVAEAVANLDKLISQRRWDVAVNEANRIGRLYPDSPRVEGLRHRVEQARMYYKADLERRFLHAAQDDHVDEAMTLLKELDLYLTEADAAPYREVARGVIGKARENLGVRFKLAVQDRRWDEAGEVGQRIIAEFPNSRMADEVRNMLDTIRLKSSAMARGHAT